MDVPNRVSWVNVAVGVLAIISPFVNGVMSVGARWDIVITGLVIAIFALVELSVSSKPQHGRYWPVVNLLAGIWLIISTAFVRDNTGMMWSNVALGILAVVTALTALSYERLHAESHGTQHA
jgi:hypothetical protein